MKFIKQTMLIAVAAIGTYTANAQTIAAAKVPAAVKGTFMKAYPTVTKVKWEMEKGNYEAGFTSQKQEMSAVFQPDGTQLEAEMEIKSSELPAAVLTYLKSNYKGAAIKEAAKITKTGGEVNYEAEVKGKDLLFDKDGKFIKVAED